MGSTKHEKSFVDFEQPYEQNIIGLKGIVVFGVMLLVFIVTGFLLMWALENVLESDAIETKGQRGPMALKDVDRLPPEPRLQLAPGFGVEGPDGKVNLELKAPQAEYWELEKQWEALLKNGRKDPDTGAVTAMGIDEAKEKLLGQQVKARSGPEADQTATRSKMYYSDASSGRVASEKRR